MAVVTHTRITVLIAALIFTCLYIFLTFSDSKQIRASFRTAPLLIDERALVQNIFKVYDAKLQDQWPARVDLMIRTGIKDVGMLGPLFRSIELFWPDHLGNKYLILDEEDRWMGLSIPSYFQVYYERFPPGVQGRLGNQWSNLWADNYTKDSTAEYIAMFDADCVFQTKVTPDLLFKDKKVILIGSYKQRDLWEPAFGYWLGNSSWWHATFMWNLPVVFPKKILPELRKHMYDMHRDLGYFDNLFIEWQKSPVWNSFSQFTIIGNYMYHMYPHKYHFVLETRDEPVLRIGSHIVYQNSLNPSAKLSPKYFEIASVIITEGICFSVPPNIIPGCKIFENQIQDRLWIYAYRNEWGESLNRYNSTKIYWDHFNFLHSLYKP